jgi:hypothetical protein
VRLHAAAVARMRPVEIGPECWLFQRADGYVLARNVEGHDPAVLVGRFQLHAAVNALLEALELEER